MELCRIFKNKKFIAAVISLLLLNCVAFYITQQKNIEDFGIMIDTYYFVLCFFTFVYFFFYISLIFKIFFFFF